MGPAFPDAPAGLAWPPGTTWAWRPPVWRGRQAEAGLLSSGQELGPGIKVFHSADDGVLRAETGERAPLSLHMSAGEFASLVIDLDADALRALTPRRIVRLAGLGSMTGPGRVYGRMNLRHGPNIASQTREADLASGTLDVAFDLSRIGLDHARIAQGWVDLMVAQPQETVLTLRDLALSCHPRAEL
ncbi:MAG: DUF6478 family protein [Pseudomonadota bacterium]